jgi:predicted dehydrogenase
MSKTRIGIIGIGGICNAAHIPTYVNNPRVDIVAVCDILEERATTAKNTYFPSAAVYSKYADLLQDESIDAVDICTPNYLHSEIAVAALDAGKHVFCEKPDAINPHEALRMQEAAQRNQKHLMVMRNNRFLNTSQYLKQYIEEGNAGELYAGRCGWIRRRGIPGKGGWFTTKAQSGGGPLIDLGVHMIDLAIWLMGNPRPVAVSGSTFCKFAEDSSSSDSVHSSFGDAKADGIFDVEDLAMGFIKFDNGACLQIEFSWASNIENEVNFVELRGTKAGFSWSNGHIKIFTENQGTQINIQPSNDTITGGHSSNLLHFLDVLQNGIKPGFIPQQGVDMIKILDAMYQSAQSGNEVRL